MAPTHRERFFAVLEGTSPDYIPFIPDITDWYVAHQTPPGKERQHSAGAFISDSDPVRQYPGTLPGKYAGWSLMDFYRRFDWGFHAHLYDWYDLEYGGGVERTVERDERELRVFLHTPKGTLAHMDQLAGDGTWCPREHFVKSTKDLEALQLVIEAQHYTPRYERMTSVLDELGGQGQVDTVIPRSPFGKFVQEYMGFERTIYAVVDIPERIEELLALQEEKDLELIRMAAGAPARLVIISDHADENLIAPPMYEQYCVPYYRKACDILHQAGKFVSTHLDGNFRGHFPHLAATGFDLLDGCTPAPMFNYEVEDLAAALPPGMCAFLGVPSSLLCQGLPDQQILAFGDRIMEAFRGRGFLNVADILPPDGDIEQVIALGELAQRRNADVQGP